MLTKVYVENKCISAFVSKRVFLMSGWLSDFMNVPVKYIHFTSWLQISVSNLVVILVMLALFVAAILVPFPGTAKKSNSHRGEK
jgi:hypothetical protein